MSKHIPSISGLACLAWIAFWSWWLPNEHSLSASDKSISTSSFSVSDENVRFSANEIFSFQLSNPIPVVPMENMTLFDSIAQYLSTNPQKKLILTGQYLPSNMERNKSPYPNLGLARANSIKSILVEEGADQDQISVKGRMVQNCYLDKGKMFGGVDFNFMEKPAEQQMAENIIEKQNPEAINNANKNDDKKEGKKNPETLRPSEKVVFIYNEEVFILAKKNRSVLDKIRRMVRKNPSCKLILSGYSEKKEEAEVNGNLAERRVRAVRRYLVDNGVRRKNIIMESNPGAAKTDTDRKVEITILK